jgi:phosphatidate cytidylyltransferase
MADGPDDPKDGMADGVDQNDEELDAAAGDRSETPDIAPVVPLHGWDDEAASPSRDDELFRLTADGPVPAPSPQELDSPLSTAERVAFEDYTEDHYMQSTTREYQGLAEAVAEAAKEEHAQSAVAASMPGVSTGVVGFEDVTGEEADDVELIDRLDRARRSDLALRVGTGLGLIAVFLGSLAAGPAWITLFLTAVVVIGQGEFYSAVRKAGFTPMALIGLLGGIAVMLAAWFGGPFSAAGVLAGTIIATALWYALVPRAYPLSNTGVTVFAVAWVALPMSFAIPLFRAQRSFQIVLGLVLITAAADVAAYFFGRSLGRSKMAPVLSPNKSWEGYAGGVLGATAMGAVLGSTSFMEPITVTTGIIMALAIGSISPVGDLAESVIKRLLGLKDMGSILPGHGGVLDRIDAFIVAIPIGYITYLLLGIL